MNITMLFNDIELPVIKLDVITLHGSQSCLGILSPKGLGPQVFSTYIKRPKPAPKRRMPYNGLPAIASPNDVDVNIIFPTCRWTARYRAPSPEDIPTVGEVRAGKIVSGDLLLESGLRIPGTMFPYTEAEKAEVYGNLNKKQRESVSSAELQGLTKMLGKVMAKQDAAENARATDSLETHRLLHRATRKLDGVPPMREKLEIATHSMAKATLQFQQRVKLKDGEWEIYDRIEHRHQNQSEVALDLGMKPYQVSRAWKRIRDAFASAGYPLTRKFTLRSAKLDKDGTIVAKPPKKREQFQKTRPSA